MTEKIFVSWSSGKDSAWMLHKLKKQAKFEISGLFTTLNELRNRVAVHDVRKELLLEQAECLGYPLHIIDIPHPCSNAIYEQRMASIFETAGQAGVGAFAFGDLYLGDIRRYREGLLENTNLLAVFPLWEIPTRQLALDMVESGLRAKITCVNPKLLDPSFVGREFDKQFLQDLPDSVDPCGENGEFHTFVYAGPLFSRPLSVRITTTEERDGFYYADVILN